MSEPRNFLEKLLAGPWSGQLLALLTWLAYVNGLRGEFLFDDHLLIQYAWRHVPVSEWGWGLPSPFGHAAQRPLVTASFYPDALFFGMNTLGYHGINLGLQALNVLLVWRVATRLEFPPVQAWIIAAVFAVHPVQTESVTYISGRRDLLYGLFFFWAWLVYLKERDAPGWRNTAVVLLLYFIGLQAKEGLVVLPAVILLHESLAPAWSGEQREPLLTRAVAALRARWGLYLGTVLIGVPLVLHRALVSTHTMESPVSTYFGGTLASHIFTAIKAQCVLLWRLVCPLTLLADYHPDNGIYSTGLSDPHGWLALITVIALLAITAWHIRRRTRAGFALGFLVITMLPTSQLVRLTELTAEHYLYIPMFGFAVLVALGYERLAALARPRAAQLAAVAVAVLLGLFLARCWVRNLDYADPVTFWRAVVRDSPRSGRAHVNIGTHLSERGASDEEVMPYYERAIEYDPNLPEAWANAGRMLARRREYDRAVEYLQRSVELRPVDVVHRLNLALALFARGDEAAGAAQVAWVREHDPDHPRLPDVEAAIERAQKLKTEMETEAGEPE